MTWGNNSVFQILIIQGSQAVTGLFLYNGLGAPGNPPQFAAVASTVTTDPFGNAITSSKILIQGNVITESGGIFRTAAAAPLIQLDGPHNALLLYNAAAALTETVASITTSDGLGNTVQQGFTAYGSVNTTYASLIAAALQFHTSGDTASPEIAEIANAGLSLSSGQTAALGVEAIFSLNSAAAGVEPLATLSAALELVNAAATPAVNSGGATAFGGGGQLRVIDGADSNNYTTQRLSIIASHTTLINSLTEISLTDLTVPVSSGRTYRVEGMVIGVNGANVAIQAVGIDGPAASNCNIEVTIFSATAGTFKNFGEITALGGRVGTATNLAAAERFIAFYRGDITFTAAGNLVLTGSCVTLAADTWTSQTRSFLEVMPV